MCDDEIHQFEGTLRAPETPISRRAFGLSAAAAASLAATVSASLAHAQATVTEKDVDIKLSITDTPGFGDQINNSEWSVM